MFFLVNCCDTVISFLYDCRHQERLIMVTIYNPFAIGREVNKNLTKYAQSPDTLYCQTVLFKYCYQLSIK